MRRSPVTIAAAGLVAAVVLAPVGHGQGPGQGPVNLPGTITVRDKGQTATPAYEGWYQNTDGSYSLLVGYFNRNKKEVLDVPIGPNNRIEPGGPDYGQPTHFEPGREYGVFAIRVPADFGKRQLAWTLVTHGIENTVTMHLDPNWIVTPFVDPGSENTPPVVRFDPQGETFTGPPIGFAATYRTAVNQPLALTLFLSDQAARLNVEEVVRPPRGFNFEPPEPDSADYFPPRALSVHWTKYRGAGEVLFDQESPRVAKANGQASTTARFSTPGEYVLRAQANDATGDGGGGFQCCWSNVHVKVVVE